MTESERTDAPTDEIVVWEVTGDYGPTELFTPEVHDLPQVYTPRVKLVCYFHGDAHPVTGKWAPDFISTMRGRIRTEYRLGDFSGWKPVSVQGLQLPLVSTDEVASVGSSLWADHAIARQKRALLGEIQKENPGPIGAERSAEPSPARTDSRKAPTGPTKVRVTNPESVKRLRELRAKLARGAS